MASTMWKFACGAAALAAAGCGPSRPPQVAAPPPPPPAPVVARPMPTPPNSSAPDLVLPATDATGTWQTLNYGIRQQQALWQFRIALNVAALNCRGPDNQQLIDNYSRFLSVNRSAIAAAERRVIADLGRANGTSGVAARDQLSTRLYNYFAQPPVTRDFCDIALPLSAQAAAEPTATIVTFAETKLQEIDRPFVNFYSAYATYVRELASWRAQQPPTAMGLTGSP